MSKKDNTYDNDILNEQTGAELTDEPLTENTQPLDEDDEETDDESRTKTTGKRLMQSLLQDSDVNAASLRELVKSIEFNGEWFRHNLLFIAIVTICLLVFVTNRYQAQVEMIEEAELKTELDAMKYKWLTRFSELTTATRQSQIEDRLKQLGDSTLKLSKQAPFIIKADK